MYKMYAEMSDKEEQENEDSDDKCVICLDDASEEVKYYLSEKFGCECKNVVHEGCLKAWVDERVKDPRVTRVSCLVCRCEVGVLFEGDPPPDSAVINVGMTARERQVLEAMESYHNRNDQMAVFKARVACIGVLAIVMALLLLSLAGGLS